MKILVVSQYFWPENFRINDLVREWVFRGHQVTVLTGLPNYPAGKVLEAYRNAPKAYLNYEGARVIRVPILSRGTGKLRLILNYLSFVLSASFLGSWRLRGILTDVIFVYEPSPVTVGLPAIFLGKIKKAPIVFWVLDLWPETLSALGIVRSPHVIAMVGRLVRFIYDRCALVLGQSRGFIVSIGRHCSDYEKIRYFPSWAEDIFAQANANVQPASEVPSKPGGFTVLFAGNIGEAQDMPAVVDAADLLKDNLAIRWIIVGDGRKFKWLQAEVLKRGLQDKILLPGRFSLERMPSFYAHADALLVSLKDDPVFGMTIPGKIQSYLMAGIPLIGMLDGEGAAVINEANAGLTCGAGDSVGLSMAVESLAGMSKEERFKLAVNGRRYAQVEFDRVTQINKLDALLQEAISGEQSKKHKGKTR